MKLGKPCRQYIQQKPGSKQLSTSQASCVALIEAVSQHLALENAVSESIPSIEEIQPDETIQQ
jgi:hypothetical protein